MNNVFGTRYLALPGWVVGGAWVGGWTAFGVWGQWAWPW